MRQVYTTFPWINSVVTKGPSCCAGRISNNKRKEFGDDLTLEPSMFILQE